MPKVRVLYDALNWEVTEDDGTLRHYRARYGDVVDLPQAEVDRLGDLKPPAFAEEGEVRDLVLEEIDRGGRGGANLITDEQIQQMTAFEAVAFVAQYPEEARRVFDLEQQGKKRAQVLQATGFEMDENDTEGAVFPRGGVDRLADPRDGLRADVQEAVAEEKAAKKRPATEEAKDVGEEGNVLGRKGKSGGPQGKGAGTSATPPGGGADNQ